MGGVGVAQARRGEPHLAVPRVHDPEGARPEALVVVPREGLVPHPGAPEGVDHNLLPQLGQPRGGLGGAEPVVQVERREGRDRPPHAGPRDEDLADGGDEGGGEGLGGNLFFWGWVG